MCFAIIGVLAIGVASGAGGATTAPQGAFNALARGGWTRVLLVALTPGLFAYALWRFAQSLFDRGGMGHDAGGLFRRGIQCCQGLLYTALAVSAVRVLLGARAHSNEQRHAVAGILGWPGGRELVGLIAAGFAVTGGVIAYWALSGRFKESLAMEDADERVERLVSVSGVIGLCSLAVVLGTIAWFLLKAAATFDPRDAVSIGGALGKLARAPYGPWLLGIVSAGFIVYGLFNLLQTRFHRA